MGSQRWMYDSSMDRHMDDQHQTIIPNYSCVSGYKNATNNTNTKLLNIFCMFSMLGKNSADNILNIFLLLPENSI